jgi:hypothetical protein
VTRRRTGLSSSTLFYSALVLGLGAVAVFALFLTTPWSSLAESSGTSSEVTSSTAVSEGLTGVTDQGGSDVSGAPEQLEGEPFRTCEVCHADFLEMPPQTPTHDLIFDHEVHLGQEIECVTCHRPPLGHFDTPAPMMMACLGCHEGETAPSDCSNCHRLIEEIAPGLDEPVVHLLPDINNRRTCEKCHDVETWCEQCHGVEMPHPGDWVMTHPTLATTHAETCEKCHQSRDVTFCVRCHGVEMPHPSYWYSSHGDIAQDNEQVCVRCHPSSPQFCNQCHHAGFSPTPEWADSQHGDAVSEKGSSMCLVCHEQAFCEECHTAGGFLRP